MLWDQLSIFQTQIRVYPSSLLQNCVVELPLYWDEMDLNRPVLSAILIG